MKHKKIILISFVFGYIIITFVINFINKNNNIIYLGNYTKVRVTDNNITVNYSNDNLRYTPIKLYFNNNFINGFIESTDHDYYSIYDESGVVLHSNKIIIAYSGDYDLKVINLDSSDYYNNKDLEKLEEIKNSNNLIGEIKSFKKVTYDLDNNSEKEDIVSVQLKNDGTVISIVYVVINDNPILLNQIQGEEDGPNCQTETLDYLIDFNEDNIYEIVTNRDEGIDAPTYEIIYEYVAGEYKEIKEE